MPSRALRPSATQRKRRYLRNDGGASTSCATQPSAGDRLGNGVGDRHADPAGELDDHRQGQHPVAHDVEGAGRVAHDGEVQGGDRVGLVEELDEGVEAHHRGHELAGEIPRERVVHGRPEDRSGPQDGDGGPRRPLGELSGLVFRVDLVREERLAQGRAQRMLLGEKVGVRGAGPVEPRQRPEHELSQLRVPGGDGDVHRPDALELVRPCGRVGGRREKGEVCEGVDMLGREDLGDPGLGGGLGQVHLVRARLFPSGGRGFQIDGDDAAHAFVLLEHPDEVAAQKPRRAGDGDGTKLRARRGRRAVSNADD